jgi:hypothetical protein
LKKTRKIPAFPQEFLANWPFRLKKAALLQQFSDAFRNSNETSAYAGEAAEKIAAACVSDHASDSRTRETAGALQSASVHSSLFQRPRNSCGDVYV